MAPFIRSLPRCVIAAIFSAIRGYVWDSLASAPKVADKSGLDNCGIVLAAGTAKSSVLLGGSQAWTDRSPIGSNVGTPSVRFSTAQFPPQRHTKPATQGFTT
jgi:hypothetical protein